MRVKLIRHHLLQISDEIRDLTVRESFQTTSLVISDPSFEFHLSWSKTLRRVAMPGGGLAKVPLALFFTAVPASLQTEPPLPS